MQPYDEDKVKDYCKNVVKPTYKEAERELDDTWFG